MNKYIGLGLAAVAMTWAWVAVAPAALIGCPDGTGSGLDYQGQYSYVTASFDVYGGGGTLLDHGYQNITATDYGPFSAVAMQGSTVSAETGAAAQVMQAVFGSASISGCAVAQAQASTAESTTANGEAAVWVKFALPQAANFTLWGVLSSTEAAYAQFKIYDADTYQDTVYAESAWGMADAVDMDVTGTLSAGTYMLYAYANAWAGGAPFVDNAADFDFAVTFCPVPEPATLALLGVPGLFLLRKRRA